MVLDSPRLDSFLNYIRCNLTKINNLHCIGCSLDLHEIGQLICTARKSRKLSQADLGQQLGMSRATISGIENGTVPEIGIRKILSICAALGLELRAQKKTNRPTLQQLMNEQHNA